MLDIMDTPTYTLPLDPREQAIFESLLRLQDELTLLKRDRSTYIKSADVISLYQRTAEQVKLLDKIRTVKPKDDNQVDRVLDRCFQMLSLFFMTIGRNNEAPAAHALTSTIKRLLDHLTEADLYSAKDLTHISATVERLRNVVKNAEGKYSPKIISLLSHRIDLCQTSLMNLQNRLGRLHGDLATTHERLVSIFRSVSLANTSSKFSATEVQNLQAQLNEIDSQRVAGNFVGKEGNVLEGNDEVCGLLNKCFKWSDTAFERQGEMPEAFIPTYQILVSIRNRLESQSLTQAWSLRETDLYDYQRQLDKIDESRVDGNFKDADGNPAEMYVQGTLLYLIRRSYGYIYYLMAASEPVSEGLLPVYNQLQTLKRCLIEVKNSGGVSSPRELYPYSMKLSSIESMRVDGKFMVGQDVPEGQGSVSDLLAECYELSYELQVAIEREREGSQ